MLLLAKNDHGLARESLNTEDSHFHGVTGILLLIRMPRDLVLLREAPTPDSRETLSHGPFPTGYLLVPTPILQHRDVAVR